MSKNSNNIPKSRTSSLLSMATKVALKEGKTLFQNHAEKKMAKMVAQADIIVNHVGQLKGAAMKAVQMLSVEGQDVLPPEVLKILEKLQSQAPPLSNQVMLDSLKEELGSDLFIAIKELSEEPIASASIGQVYAAKINQQPVIIKIQYPGIADSVDEDLKTLKKLIQVLLFVSRKDINIDEAFIELKRVLVQETDYLNEVKNIKAYREQFKDHPNYCIPEVYAEFSTQKVLVLSRVEGLEFTTWLEQDPSQIQKQKVGTHLLNLYKEEFFKNHLVQTDPNPANFLINKKNQIVLLDFGATVSYSSSFVRNYQSLLKIVLTGNDQDILDKLEAINFISPKEHVDVKNEFVRFIKLSVFPFEKERQPFDFSDPKYSNEIRRNVMSFTKKLKYSPPPAQIIFLHRKLGGIFQLLRKLGIQVDLSQFMQEILNLKI